MNVFGKVVCAVVLALASGLSLAAEKNEKIVMQEFMVPSADPGISLYVRNKRPAGIEKFDQKKILLYVHGSTYPAES